VTVVAECPSQLLPPIGPWHLSEVPSNLRARSFHTNVEVLRIILITVWLEAMHNFACIFFFTAFCTALFKITVSLIFGAAVFFLDNKICQQKQSWQWLGKLLGGFSSSAVAEQEYRFEVFGTYK
jgi:hypothetical protein